MKNFILLLALVFLLNGCHVNTLKITPSNKLELHVKNNISILGKNVKKEKLDFFSDITIQQYRLLSDEGNILFAEDVQTGLDYEFAETTLATLMYSLNESRNLRYVYIGTDIELIQVQLKNKSYINVVLQVNDVQEYICVYGFSNQEFIEIAKTLQEKGNQITMPKFQAVTFNKDSKHQTNWNVYLIYYTPLLKLMNIRGVS